MPLKTAADPATRIADLEAALAAERARRKAAEDVLGAFVTLREVPDRRRTVDYWTLRRHAWDKAKKIVHRTEAAHGSAADADD